MSANMLEAEHIHVLIWAAIHAKPTEYNLVTHTTESPASDNGVSDWGYAGIVRELRDGTETPYGQMLVDANAASVNARYREDGNGYAYAYATPQHTEWTPLEILAALNSYEYQACEVQDWPSSEAKQFCDALRRRVEARIPGAHDGPGQITAATLPQSVRQRRENMRRHANA